MNWLFVLYGLQTLLATLSAIWILYRWEAFLTIITNRVLRRYIKIILVTCCFYAAFQPANYGWYKMSKGIGAFLLFGGYAYICLLTAITTAVYLLVTKQSIYLQLTKPKQLVVNFSLLAFVPMIAELFVGPLIGFTGIYLTDNLAFTLWAGCIGGTVLLIFQNYTSQQQLKLQEKELELTKLSALNTQTKLDALQAKINPHFLYNTLNAMAGLALEDGNKTSKMAVALSILFRYNLNKEQDLYARVEEEVDMLQHYLAIEKIRFEERLQYQITISPSAEKKQVPRFILQPLAENSIKHGFKGKLETGIIDVQIDANNDILTITVADNGNPFHENFSLGFGLQGIQDKLQLLYPQKHEISFHQSPKKIMIQLFP
jgi:two-component system, LytTR family, sensor kinase